MSKIGMSDMKDAACQIKKELTQEIEKALMELEISMKEQ